MKIGLDLDDVLADGTKKFIEFHNQKYSTNLSLHNIFTYAISEILGIPEELATERIKEFDKSIFSKKIIPIKGAKKIVQKLSKSNELIVITARPKSIEEGTIAWIKENFPEIKSIFFIYQNYVEKVKTKADVCLEQGVDLLIEDNLAHAFDCAKKGIKVLLLNYPWNQLEGKLPDKIQRVKSWEEIKSILG